MAESSHCLVVVVKYQFSQVELIDLRMAKAFAIGYALVTLDPGTAADA